jgi:hypothetical protein
MSPSGNAGLGIVFPPAATGLRSSTAVGREALADAAHQGGLWRTTFAARSVLPVAALVGALRRP